MLLGQIAQTKLSHERICDEIKRIQIQLAAQPKKGEVPSLFKESVILPQKHKRIQIQLAAQPKKGEVASVSNKSAIPPKKHKQMQTRPIKRPKNGGVSSAAKKSVVPSKKPDAEDHWRPLDMAKLKIPKWIKKDPL